MKSMIRNLLVLGVILGFSFQSNAQRKASYTESVIQLETGKTLQGLVRMPLMAGEKIAFKKTLDADKELIVFEDVESIIIKGANGDALISVTNCYIPKISGKLKLTKKRALLLVDMNCSNIKGYIGVIGYKTDDEGNIYSIYADGLAGYFIKSGDDDYPAQAGWLFARYEDGSVKGNGIDGSIAEWTRKVMLKNYFEGNQEVEEFIDAQEDFSEKDMLNYIYKFCENSKK